MHDFSRYKYAQVLPVIDNILVLLGLAKYFSMLDLKSEYWQVKLMKMTKRKVHSLVIEVCFILK